MRRRTLGIVLCALALAVGGAPAHSQPVVEVTRFLPSGVVLPPGAELVGVVSAPRTRTPLLGGLDQHLAHFARNVKVPAVPPPACRAHTAWAESGTALTGYLYVWTDPQSGYTSADVLWWTDDGDMEPERDEGVVAYASNDCATDLVFDWSITDVSNMPHCLPEGAGVVGDVVPGPFTEPVFSIFGMGNVPYFTVDPYSSRAPCTRLMSTVIFKAHVFYVEKNRKSHVPIGCLQRSWNVQFVPRPGDDPTRPRPSWLKIESASEERTCLSGV